MTSPRRPGESVIDRLRRDGRFPDALGRILGEAFPADRTTTIRCPEPSHHRNGDASPSAIVEPSAGRVECRASGLSWGLLKLGVLRGYGASEAEVAERLDADIYGGARRSSSPAPGFVTTPPSDAWPYFTETAKSFGWELFTDDDGTPAMRLPTWAPDGSRARTKVRRRKLTEGDKRTGFFEGPDDAPCGLIGLDTLRATWARGDDPLVVLNAGETDLLATTWRIRVEGLDAVAVSASPGECASLQTYAALFAGRRIVVIYDNDDTGKREGPKRAREFQVGGAKLAVSIRAPAPHHDVCDYVRAGGSLRELLRTAGPAATEPPGSRLETAPLEVSSPPRRRRIPPWKPFPTGVLPGVLRRFVRAVAKAQHTDPAYAAVPCLGVIAGCIGNVRTIQLKPGWQEPAVLWCMTVGDSGSLKSPALDAVLAPVQRLQTEAFRKHAEEQKAAAELPAEEGEEWKGEPRKRGAPRRRVPPPKRYVVSDTTVEALASRLSETPRGLLLHRDELSGWIRSFDAYRSGRGGDAATWLSIHGARAITVDRKTGDQPLIHIPRAAVSVVGTIQPDTMRTAFGRDSFESGMAARFLAAYPPRRKKSWSEDTVPPGVEAAYDALVGAILDFEPATDANGALAPLALPLDADARAEWIAFYDRHAHRQAAAVGDEAALLSKIEGAAARIALVVHVARSVTGEDGASANTIDAISVRAGITLAEWFADEGLRIYETLAQPPEQRAEDILLGWIEDQGGSVTARDLSRGPRRFRGDIDGAERALDGLARGGCGMWVDAGSTDVGGRPTRRFVLLPATPTEPPSGDAATEPKPAEAGSNSEVSSPEASGSDGDMSPPPDSDREPMDGPEGRS